MNRFCGNDAADALSSVAGDHVSDGLTDALTDGILPVPISPAGLAIRAIGALFGLFF